MKRQTVILTGAGISAESGVPTFRDADGLWEGHRVEDVATSEAFARDPETVQRFYDLRRSALGKVQPNAAHLLLALLEKTIGEELLIVTQNVDDLHERAGSKNVIHMHGELGSALCGSCNHRMLWTGDLSDADPCPNCNRGVLRPDIVWFGEIPYRMNEIEQAIFGCKTFVAIGTSGVVFPAASFVSLAASGGAHTLELNLTETEISYMFDETRQGSASQLVPQWVSEVLASR